MMARPSEEKVSLAFRDAVSEQSFKFQRKPAVFCVDEFDGLNGRADFVLSPSGLENMSQEEIARFITGVTTLSSAQIVCLLSQENLSEESLSVRIGLSRGTITSHLRNLKSAGIVEKGDNGEFRISSSFIFPLIELWAIEIKVDNWRRALYQALQYRSYSHCAMIVMPMMNARCILSHAEAFRSHSIGVIAIDTETGEMRTVVRAKKGKPPSTHQYLYAISIFLKRLHPELCV